MENNPTTNLPLMSTLTFPSYGQQPPQTMMLQQQQLDQQSSQQQFPPGAIPSHLANLSQNHPRLTPEKRATHNAIERARRESLNDRFHKLAMSIPTLRQIRKPSKSLIVQKSLEHIVDLHRRSETMESAIVRLQRRVAELEEEARTAKSGVMSALGTTPAQPSAQNKPQSPPVVASGKAGQQDSMAPEQQMMIPQQMLQPEAHMSYMGPGVQLHGVPMVPIPLNFHGTDAQRFSNGLALNTTIPPPFHTGLTLDTSSIGQAYHSLVLPQGYGSASSPASNYSDSSASDDEPQTASHSVPFDFTSFVDSANQQTFRKNAMSATGAEAYFPSFITQNYRQIGTTQNASVLTPSPSPQSHPQLLLQGLTVPKPAQ